MEKWTSEGRGPANLRIISGVMENSMASKIRDAARVDPFILVGLEGTAAKIVVHALQEADYVIIPMRGSSLDADEAAKAITLIHDAGLSIAIFGSIHRYTYGIYHAHTKQLAEWLKSKGRFGFLCVMCERDAFREIFSFKLPLRATRPHPRTRSY